MSVHVEVSKQEGAYVVKPAEPDVVSCKLWFWDHVACVDYCEMSVHAEVSNFQAPEQQAGVADSAVASLLYCSAPES
jgi:hypothetical protein